MYFLNKIIQSNKIKNSKIFKIFKDYFFKPGRIYFYHTLNKIIQLNKIERSKIFESYKAK